MLEFIFGLVFPYLGYCDYNKCYSEEVVSQEVSIRQQFINYTNSLDIKWYKLGRAWEWWYYDCSSYISLFLIEKGIINSYILYTYWIQKKISEMVVWDLVVRQWLNWNRNHTSIYMWISWSKILIYDTYKLKNGFTVREIPIKVKWYIFHLIENPAISNRFDLYWKNKQKLWK